MQALKKPVLAAAAILLATACGRGNGDPNAGSDGGYGTYKLGLVGAPVLTVHPGEKRSLQVALAQEQIGGVPNAPIAFDFQDGDPANAQLETTSVSTDSSGVATVKFTAGSNAVQGFKLVASAPKYPEARPVAFSIRVVPVQRMLQI